MCNFQSLKQTCSQQGGWAYDAGVTKGESKIRGGERVTNADAQRRKSQTYLNILGIDTNA